MAIFFLTWLWSVALNDKLPSERLHFENISVAQGLSQSTVQCLLQDRAGFLWVGTHIGLNRYDGYRFQTYRHDPNDPQSLPNNNVQCLLEDREGRLWIGTNGGLCLLTGRDTANPRFHHFPIDDQQSNTIAWPNIAELYQDTSGQIWVAGAGHLYRFREATLDFERFKLPHYQANGIAEDRFGRLWVATNNGILMLSADRQQTQHLFGLYGRPCQTDSFMPHNFVSCLIRDNQGDVWAAFPQRGLILIPEDPNDLQPTILTLRRPAVLAGIQRRNGDFWLSTNGGVVKLEPGSLNKQLTQHDPKRSSSISADVSQCIIEDDHDNIWIGVVLGGINKHVPDKPVFEHYIRNPYLSASLHGDLVYAFAEGPDDIVWIGSRDGISAFQVSNRRFLKLVGDPSLEKIMDHRQVLALHVDSRGDLWIGSRGQLLVVTPDGLDDKEGTLSHTNLRRYTRNEIGHFLHVSSFLEEADGTLWITTFGKGLLRTHLDQESHSFKIFNHSRQQGSISSPYTRGLLRDRSGTLWVGSWGDGLNRFHDTSETFKTYRRNPDQPGHLSNDMVTVLAESSQQRAIWVGTYAGGLNRLDVESETFTTITQRDGLPDNTIYGIVVVEDDLWLSTNNGIARVSHADDANGRVFTKYSVHDGLQSQEFNRGGYFRDHRGQIYMGGIHGFNIFDPNHIDRGETGNGVMLTNLWLNGKAQRFDTPLYDLDQLVFGPKTRLLGFEFAALNFANPAENRYSYRLAGADQDWQKTGERRSLQYSNLKPGRYQLQAYSLNRADEPSGEQLLLDITILPAYYQTWWFRLLIVLLVILTILAILRARILAWRREQHQRRIFAQNLIEVQERDRSRIANALHDSLGQNLLAINNEIQMQAQAPQAKPIKDHLLQISEWVREAIEEVRHIAYNLRPHQLDRLGLKRALTSITHHLSHGSGLTFHIELEEVEGVLSKEKETHLFRVVQECLNNIMRHAQAQQVWIKMTLEADALILEIRDDGIGFDREAIGDSGLGLRTIAERSRVLGARFWIESEKGTRVSVAVPIGEKADD
jgi:signal transduction histidine kinase/ligand-binding sensor domain-containing protein